MPLSRALWPTARIDGLKRMRSAERACGGCHAIADRPGSTVQGTAAPSFGAIAGRPNQTSQRLQSFIMTPHRPMPGIPLSLAEVNDVVAYILSLK